MIDFALNNAGDIILEHKETYDIFKLSFVASGYPVFKTNFLVLNNPPTKKDTRSFRLRFTTNQNESAYKKIKTIHKDDEIRQRIMLKLRTELNDIFHHQDFGSNINMQRHKIITDANLELLASMAQDSIQNITNDTYRVEAKQVKRNNNFVTENINLYIYRNEELFFVFEL
jgi:hypothetical protein